MGEDLTLYYTEAYKYRIAKTIEIEISNCPFINQYDENWHNDRISMPFAYIERRGMPGDRSYFLVLEKYYGWDGATWAIDNKKFRLPSGAHDALLEMIGLGLLSADPWKLWTDNFLIELCKRKKMNKLRRWWVYKAVRKLGDPEGSKPRKVYIA